MMIDWFPCGGMGDDGHVLVREMDTGGITLRHGREAEAEGGIVSLTWSFSAPKNEGT